ncbi:hypothetical protein Belba_2512 [Belliella baltica DSM 15883]|uniref:Uncharacterized protein n=1 Tax=Belliella baltica (strain DSM 15883 / CIP 108006 / LMG 21964 / BA134) TaxID=866536 RepID=I3Z748_BELBD|nr:hypothetical protein [Belliella baltica]AFL85066.1 hypothetical protein Belba_2512 [Belliella baltica DSM 15883]
MKFEKYPILLTAAINPADHEFVGRKGSQIRELDYFKSLIFYLENDHIVIFIDNSNFESKMILDKFKGYKNFEYLFFSSQHSHLGKGHGEKEIIDFALQHSEMLKTSTFFIKITGRLIIKNLQLIINNIEFNKSIVHGNFTRNFSWADTRLMILNKEFYEEYFSPICDKYLNEKEGVLFEHVFAKSLHAFLSNDGKFEFLPIYPDYSGYNGSNNSKYDQSFFKKLKYFIFFKIKRYVNKQTI